MVTFAQAQERAEEWINGDVPAYQHREVRVREFGLGFVVWGEDRAEGPRSDGGGQRLVIARDSGEATLWPALPVGEVVRRYEEEYGREAEVADAVPAPAARVDLNQTSFLLSPPEWLQEAADKLGVPDRRPGGDGVPAGAGTGPVPGSGAGSVGLAETQTGVPAAPGGTPWAGTDTNADAGEDRSVPLPATVFAPPLGDADDGALGEAETALLAGGSQLPRTAVNPALDEVSAQGGTPLPTPRDAPSYGYPQGPAAPGTPGPSAPSRPQAPAPPPASSYGYPQAPAAPGQPLAPNASDIADAATSRAAPPPRRARGGAGAPPPPPGVPGAPGVHLGGAPQPPVGGYAPTQMVSAPGAKGPEGPARAPGAQTPPGAPNSPNTPGAPGGPPPGDVHRAATVLADPSGMGGGAQQPPGAPAAPPGPPTPPRTAPPAVRAARRCTKRRRCCPRLRWALRPPPAGRRAPRRCRRRCRRVRCRRRCRRVRCRRRCRRARCRRPVSPCPVGPCRGSSRRPTATRSKASRRSVRGIRRCCATGRRTVRSSS
ncbi:hypothetical protein SAMN05216533_5031 [Streptomyces sp. Ag109_O5-10]|nr:hypothetical protein SAMN05216533_5031 [Streptomyces sp. Ag109_O5-10]